MSKSPDVLSAEIRNFISRNIFSVAMLDILLFFQKNPDREWTGEQANTELRSNSAAIEIIAQQLIKKGFLKQGSTEHFYQYAPRTQDLDRLLRILSQLYSKSPTRIIDEIYSPKKAIEEFANAFKLKREDEDG